MDTLAPNRFGTLQPVDVKVFVHYGEKMLPRICLDAYGDHGRHKEVLRLSVSAARQLIEDISAKLASLDATPQTTQEV